jgi:hypothetical protein
MTTKPHRFHVGETVRDVTSRERGVVVFVFQDVQDLIAVRFQGRKEPLAICVEDVERVLGDL